MLHEAGVAIAIYNNTTLPLPNYTVTDNGATVSVCNDAGACDSFGDFRIAGVLLDTFSIDGQPLAERVSAFERPTTVEALTVDASYALRRPRDEALSVVVLLGSEGGGTTFFWERASYVDIAGSPFADRPSREPVPGATGGRTVHRRPRDVRRGPARRSVGDPDHHRPDTSCDDHPHPCHTSLMSARHRLVAIVLAGSLGAVGATSSMVVSGAALAPEATALPTTVAGAPVFDAVDFFTDLFAGINADPHDHGDLPQRVVAGSPADAFVTYLFGFGSARETSRQGPLEPFTVSGDDTGGGGLQRRVLRHVLGFVVSDGRLESFLLNGVTIEGRLAEPSKAIEHGRPVRVRVVGAFERVTVDELAVVIAIEADEDLTVSWEESAYVDPSWNRIDVDLLASAYPG